MMIEQPRDVHGVVVISEVKNLTSFELGHLGQH